MKVVEGKASIGNEVADIFFSLADCSDSGTKMLEAVNLFEAVPFEGCFSAGRNSRDQ